MANRVMSTGSTVRFRAESLKSRPITDTVGVLLQRASSSSGALSRRETHAAILRAQCGCEDSRNLVVEANMGLVVATVRAMGVVQYERSVTFDDLTTYGMLGLCRAIDKYRPELGYEFSTYAVTWIKQSVLRGTVETRRIIRIPLHENDRMLRAGREITALTAQLERMPTARELAVRMDLSESVAREYLVQSDALYLDEVYETESEEFNQGAEMHIDDSAPCPQQSAEAVLYRSAVCEAIARAFELSNLTEKEKTALEYRFGLNGRNNGQPATLDTIAIAMEFKSRERGRQLVNNGLKKLRKHLSGTFNANGELTGD